MTDDEPSLINKIDHPHPLKFAHYDNPILGPVCIDEYCDKVKETPPHMHPKEQQYYG